MNLENTMSSLRRVGMYFLLGTLGYPSYSIPALPQIAMATSGTLVQHAATERDGQHDFDFEIGTWKTHLTRLQHPLTGSTAWNDYEGTSVVRKIWNGRANLVELNVDGTAGHIQGLSLRLYNPKSHQWSLNYANASGGALGQPTVGEFKNGRGEFYDQEPLDGRVILVRNVWSDITPTSCRFEQAFSEDGGKTWEVNWIATDTRLKEEPDGSSGVAEAGPGVVIFDLNGDGWDDIYMAGGFDSDKIFLNMKNGTFNANAFNTIFDGINHLVRFFQDEVRERSQRLFAVPRAALRRA